MLAFVTHFEFFIFQESFLTQILARDSFIFTTDKLFLDTKKQYWRYQSMERIYQACSVHLLKRLFLFMVQYEKFLWILLYDW